MAKTYNILVDLDSLLDTRLAIATELDPVTCNDLMVVNDEGLSWWTREHDHFDHVKSPIRIDGYKERWDNRDASVLPKSLMTNLLLFIREQTLEILEGQFGNGSLDLVDYTCSNVDINIYPYTLSESVSSRIAEMVKRQCALGTTTRCVAIPHDRLTPDYLESGYKAYFLYDFSNWIHNFSGQMVQSTLPRDTMFFVPSVLHDNTLDTIEESDDAVEQHRFDKQMALKLALARFIHYEPLPVMLFSIFHTGYMETFKHEMKLLKDEIRDRRVNDYN